MKLLSVVFGKPTKAFRLRDYVDASNALQVLTPEQCKVFLIEMRKLSVGNAAFPVRVITLRK